MNRQAPAKVEELCLEALARGGSARADFLQRACGDDTALRREVESLLAGEGATDSLETPIWNAAVTRFRPGVLVGPYEIDGLIGSGGMGEVYKARDSRLGRTVAIKVLPPGLAWSEDRRRRFMHEAHAAASLNHPHICTIYDVGTYSNNDGGPPQDYLVMEFLEGETLAERLRKGALPVGRALRLADQIADGLAAAHRRGVVHRDLKPGNVMLAKRLGAGEERARGGVGPATGWAASSDEESAKILDFGLAKESGGRGPADDAATATATTQPGAILGTLGYQSPEQARGEVVDLRTDLFSFGITFYEMLTGRQPFRGPSDADTIGAVLHVHPPPPSHQNELVPESCDAIVAKALEKDRELRYQSASEIRVDLARVRRQIAPDPLTPSPPRRITGSRDRHLAASIGVAAIALVTVASFGLWRFERRAATTTAPFERAAARQLTTAAAWEGEPSLSPDGTLVAYTVRDGLSRHIFVTDPRTGVSLQLTKDDADDRFSGWTPDGSSVLFSSDRDGGGVFAVSRLGGDAPPRLVLADASEPAVAPDGKRVAFSRVTGIDQARIFVASLDRVEDARQVTFDEDGLWDHHRPSWSTDGRFLAYRAHMAIWRVDPGRRGAVRLTREGQQCDRPVWAPDGSLYYSSKIAGSSAIWRLPPSGDVAQRVTPGAGEREPTLSADGRTLAYSVSNTDYNLVLRDVRSGREDRFGGVRIEYLPALSPDGKEAYYVADQDATGDQVWAIAVDNGKFAGQPHRVTSPPGQASRAVCSADGKWLAYHRVIGDQRDIWTTSVHGGPAIQITTDPAADVTPTWSPDGTRIAFASERDGRLHLWVVPVANGVPTGPAVRLSGGETADVAPTWSPDAKTIAYVGSAAGRMTDAWTIGADGRGGPRRVTSGVRVERVLWDASARALLVSAWWNRAGISVRRVDLRTGASTDLRPPLVFGNNPYLYDFDASWNRRFVIFSTDESRSDVWMLTTAGAPTE